MEPSKPIMNIEEVAKYLGVSAATIYRYVKQGKIPASRIGKFWRFKKEKIDEWFEKQGNTG